MARLSAHELAELVPCVPEDVRRLEDLRLLQPDETDGLYPSSAVHNVRLMAAFEEAGISVEDVARGVTAGELSFPLGLFLSETAGVSETHGELAARLGRSPELLRRLSGELGLPPNADDRIRDEDAEQETAQAHGGRPVKWLGDGVMFHFADPGGAILSGLELVEETERAISVPTRIGINAGAVVAQEGDYFGRTVNIAARIADYARPHEVLVSEAAKRSADLAGVEFEFVGDVKLKGVSSSVGLHKATRAKR